MWLLKCIVDWLLSWFFFWGGWGVPIAVHVETDSYGQCFGLRCTENPAVIKLDRDHLSQDSFIFPFCLV